MAQPDFAAITNHLQGIQNEITLAPNMPGVAGLGVLQQQMHANHLQVVALLGQMQNEQQLLPMRLYNASTSDTTPLRYPAGVLHGHPLPATRHDLLELTVNQYQDVSALLGLPVLPPSAVVTQRRQQIADYIGVLH